MSRQNPTRKKKDNSPTRNKSSNDIARYTGIATKMLAIILVGTFAGIKLDEKLALETPIFTLILTLASVGLAMYVIIRDLGKK